MSGSRALTLLLIAASTLPPRRAARGAAPHRARRKLHGGDVSATHDDG